jgi:hypothetical protein
LALALHQPVQELMVLLQLHGQRVVLELEQLAQVQLQLALRVQRELRVQQELRYRKYLVE